MRALVYDGDADFEVRDIPRPEIEEPTDVILDVECALSSGTDRHAFEAGDLPEGRIFGAEFTGVVDETGSKVAEFSVGDRVVPGVETHCGSCFYCTRGLRSHCERGGWLLGNEIDGGRAEYVRVPLADRNLHRIPDSLSFTDAVLAMSSLPTGYEAAERAGVEPGDSVAIIGAGAISLCASQCVQLRGPSEVIHVDIVESRLELARELGADRVVDAEETDALAALRESNDGRGPDRVIEAAGHDETFRLAIHGPRPGGTVSVISVQDGPLELTKPPDSAEEFWGRNLTLQFGHVNARNVPELLSFIEAGQLKPDPLLTKEIGLSEIDGVDDILGPEIIKTVIYPDQ
jgi:alcohol dehydrogenase